MTASSEVFPETSVTWSWVPAADICAPKKIDLGPLRVLQFPVLMSCVCKSLVPYCPGNQNCCDYNVLLVFSE